MISASVLEAILRSHAYLRVERPPQLWALDADDERFLFLLGEMIVVALGRATESGKDLGDLTLNVSNVVVPDDAASDGLPEGELVAISLVGPGDWGLDDVWYPGEGPTRGLLANVAPRADDAGAVFAYTRNLGEEGAVTAYFRRAADADSTG